MENIYKKHVVSAIGFIRYLELEKMDLSSLNYAIIKGEPLSFYAYSSFGERISQDIDILIPRDDLWKMEQMLKENQFISPILNREDKIATLAFSHQIVSYYKLLNIGKINVDLNFDIFWGEYDGERVSINEFLSNTIEMDIYGVRVKTLPPLKAMVQLILHHYKDMNSIFLLATRKSINYNMFKDVYYLWKNNLNDISLDRLYKISDNYKIMPYVFYVLYYTNQIFDDKLLKEYVDAFRTLEGEELLELYGLKEEEHKKWKVDFKTRLETNNLYQLIKEDLTESDMKKIGINKHLFFNIK